MCVFVCRRRTTTTECHWSGPPCTPSATPRYTPRHLFFPPLQWMGKHACIIKSIVSSSLHPPFPPSLKKEMLLLGSLPPWEEKKGLEVRETWPTSHPLMDLIPFHPGSPNGRVATAGECKCQPVLPVNYTATKLIVCLVHIEKKEKMQVWLLMGLLFSTQMQSSSFFLTGQTRRWLNVWMTKPHFQAITLRKCKDWLKHTCQYYFQNQGITAGFR